MSTYASILNSLNHLFLTKVKSHGYLRYTHIYTHLNLDMEISKVYVCQVYVCLYVCVYEYIFKTCTLYVYT